MIRTEALELVDLSGLGTGRYRAVTWTDERPADGASPLCECGGASHEAPKTAGHESPVAALACPVVRAILDARTAASQRPGAAPRALPDGGAAVVLAEPKYSYGSDHAGGIYLAVADAPTLRLTRDELAAMLREADQVLPPAGTSEHAA